MAERQFQTREQSESRESGWAEIARAAAAAAVVILVLVAGVALAWRAGGGPANAPSIATAPPTPTPRAIAFSNPTTVANVAAQQPTPPPAVVIETEEEATGDGGLVIGSAGDSADDGSAALPSAAQETTVLAAKAASDYLTLASGSWAAVADGLRNEGGDAVAEHWLRVARTPNPNFAIEAEIQVLGTLGDVCDQSFGLAGGSPQATLVFGGGVIFPCSGEGPQARITDVTTWEDGYNADTVLAKAAFDPGEAWRTYRFELRGDAITLLVDGAPVLTTEADPGINPAATDTEVGLWSQGVGVQVRNITVLALPAP